MPAFSCLLFVVLFGCTPTEAEEVAVFARIGSSRGLFERRVGIDDVGNGVQQVFVKLLLALGSKIGDVDWAVTFFRIVVTILQLNAMRGCATVGLFDVHECRSDGLAGEVGVGRIVSNEVGKYVGVVESLPSVFDAVGFLRVEKVFESTN